MATTPGVTNRWDPRIPSDRRKKVNQIGFDTYDYKSYGPQGWFVCPQP